MPSAGKTHQKVSAPLSMAGRQLLPIIKALYRDKLRAMPLDELEALFKSEWEKAAKEFVARAEKEESGRFFHCPSAYADFDHWSKAAHWTLDEAVALSFGKAPKVVNSASLQELQSVSPFAQGYARRLDLAQRAAIAQKLYDPALPILFIKWAEQNDIEFPAALAERVLSRSGAHIDWKQEYEKLEALHRAQVADWRKNCAEQRETIGTCYSQIESLTSELQRVREEATAALAASPAEKPQSTRERMGMLKVIYAMAVSGYGFDPTTKRSKLAPEIAADLARLGLSVSDDTIRRYIKEASDLLPEWQEDNR